MSIEMPVTAALLRGEADRLRRLQLPPLQERITMLEAAMHSLRDAVTLQADPLAAELRLSAPMIRWCIAMTLESITAGRLERLHADAPKGNSVALNAVVFSGNVFTAAVRPVVLSLLFGVPVIAKGSSRDAAIPKLLREALPTPLRNAFSLHCYPGDAPAELHQALFAKAELVQVFGSDRTLDSLRPHCPKGAEWLPHGHGLGLLWLDGPLSPEEAAAIADDLAAYDQRGCLSPVELLYTGPSGILPTTIERLHEALLALGIARPRGPLTDATKASFGSWLSVAQALGQTWSGPNHTLALGELPAPPPGRTLLVRPMSTEDALHRCQSLGGHLKRLAASPGIALPASLEQKRCGFGQMQRPPIEHRHDGYAPWQGLLR